MSSKAQTLILPTLCLCMALLASQVIALQTAEQDRVQAPAPAAKPPADKAPEENQASPQQEYQALLERVKKSEASVDFARMRHLQTQLDSYEPYGGDPEDRPFSALKAGDVPRAKALAEQMLAENYLDLEAHTVAATVAEKRGDAAAAAHHHYVVQGVIDSILKSGDGKTLETAFVVIAINEEYAVMQHLGLRVAGQSLIHDEEGHSYDLLEGADPQSQSLREVYFNIDSLMSALDKKLSQ